MIDTTTKKDDIFLKANEWFALKFNNANNVIQMKDKDAGKIVAKGIANLSNPYLGIISFDMKFDCKDGKYKYVILNVEHRYLQSHDIWGGDILEEKSPAVPMKMSKSHWSKVRNSTTFTLESLLSDLSEFMKNSKKDNDW